jgi:NADH-quinone oxidoreductase subunit J
MNLDMIIFIASAVVAVFGATMMVAQRNPVASVLYLILSLVAQAVCYVQLGALFLGAILVVVYAGAIMVLFLFVIMLLNLRGDEDLGPTPPAVSRFTKYIVAILITVELALIVKAAPLRAVTTGIIEMKPNETFGSVPDVAESLFTNFLYPFELTGMLLLIAVVGAVVIARLDKRREAEESEGADSSENQPSGETVKK